MRFRAPERAAEEEPVQWTPAGRFQAFDAAPADRRSFFRSRKFLFLVGGAIAGSGAALLATGERSRQAPAFNCSFYPALPLAPCIPAHAEKTRSGIRDGFGGGMLVGGFIVIYVAIGR
jgi:hypothetical protein